MRRLGVGGLLVAAAVALSGCAPLVDINHRALILGMGIDRAPTGSGYEVTLQYPDFGEQAQTAGSGGGGSGGGGSGGGSGSSVAQSVHAPGLNIGIAMDDLRAQTDRLPYVGNLSIIAIGTPLAKKGVFPTLDFFLRAGQVSESAQVVVATTDAGTFFDQKVPEGVAVPLYEYLRRADVASVPTSPSPLWRFAAMLYSRSAAAYAPLMAPSGQEEPFKGGGTAIFLRGRLVGTVTGYRASVLDWLIKTHGFPQAVVRLPGATGPVTLTVARVRRRLQVLSASVAVIHLQFEAHLSEAPGLYLDDRDISGLERLAAAQLTSQVRGILSTLQHERTDILGLAPHVLARYPDATADWPVAFSRMRLGLNISLQLTGGGRRT